MESKVYMSTFRTKMGVSVLEKLTKLLEASGMGNIDFDNKYVAIKIHFGEPGNLSYLRPNYAKTVVDFIKCRGGKPFLTDCNTLYVGRRKDALEHLEAAYENGYSPFSTGCHVIIADGLKGTDEVLVPVNGTSVKEARIGRAVMDADIVLSLNHFKGHELVGFGGAVKNIGMGCGSRAGKMHMHAAGKPQINSKACVGCKDCSKFCAHDAISFENKKAIIDHDRCVGCGRCLGTCRYNAVGSGSSNSVDELSVRIAEYTHAVLDGREQFHINLIMDVSPYCDCHAENDAPIVEDIGMLASFDPVALDCACADLINAATPLRNSRLGELDDLGDHFKSTHPITDWRVCMQHCEKMGTGVMAYELIRLD